MARKRLLCLSNGHGEDQIAARIVRALQAHDLEILAMPIVGEGSALRQLGVPIVAPTRTMPSGGFIYMDVREFLRDLREGLGRLTLEQWQVLRQLGPRCDLVLAVGDIVVLGLAWASRAPYAFVGTAKSDYYLGGKPSDYKTWERWMMNRPRCRAIYPRDGLTARNLRTWVPRAVDLGNPMMDQLEPLGASLDIPPDAVTILLLPGSRSPEAYRNLVRILAVVENLPQDLCGRPLHILCAQATGLTDAEIARETGWKLGPGQISRGPRVVHLERERFAECLHRTDLAIAMAGTATEQCVGLGKPVVTLPGEGPQFTYRFAEAQTRLLGESVRLITDGPEAAARCIERLLGDEHGLERIRHNGYVRMGKPGASSRIAEHLLKVIG
ncbi:MAG: hypothetical protein H7Y22_14040 [Gemmatimonadaceae bacterium]|nr:hypothetical protein [Gloeobacterales cyanobacterium ES-bin-141]